jgi:hypothetical protein
MAALGVGQTRCGGSEEAAFWFREFPAGQYFSNKAMAFPGAFPKEPAIGWGKGAQRPEIAPAAR